MPIRAKHKANVSFAGEKVVTAREMEKVEKLALFEGDASPDEYMERAALGIFRIADRYIKDQFLESHVILLCARGNNSGDAYTVGELFLAKDIEVTAFQIAPLERSSELCQRRASSFAKKGGKIIFIDDVDELIISSHSLIIDGLVGIGCKGEVKGLMKEVIEKINQLQNRVISIDIPSGVCGDTGIVGSSAILADITISLGVLKVGHFLNQGYHHAGEIYLVDFGMSPTYLNKMEPFASVVHPDMIRYNLPHHKRGANKYTVGQVVIIAGSRGMRGAAILSSKAALRAGAGVVRLIHSDEIEESELFFLAPEVIRMRFEALDKELTRTKALLIGPGLGRRDETVLMLEKVCKQTKIPLVIDGDALFFFKKSSSPTVLTPHRGELANLLGISVEEDDIQFVLGALRYAKEKNVVIVCKGAPTIVVSPQGEKIIIPYGNVGMASAGMGDALAGIIGALIAQGKDPWEGAILGATIHALAGDKAIEEKSTHSLIASDLIEALPCIFKKGE